MFKTIKQQPPQGIMMKTMPFVPAVIKSPEDKKKAAHQQLSNTIGSIANQVKLNGGVQLNQQPAPTSSPPPPPPPSIQQSTAHTQPPPPIPKPVKAPNQEGFMARVIYSYSPANDDELAIQENDVVQVLRLVSLRRSFFLTVNILTLRL